MNLTFIQDYSTNTRLDSELMGVPDSGIHWNQGVHPLITIGNLLAFLPYDDFTINAYDVDAAYGVFTTNYDVSNLVVYNSNYYQSLSSDNLGNDPESSPSDWLLTDINSIRLKIFLRSVEKSMISALGISRKLIENQYIYDVGEVTTTLPNDFASWVIEPKGSDYVTLRINELSIQTTAAQGTIIPVYVINQGVLVETINLTSNGGRFVFESVNTTITGKGKFRFVFASQEVKSNAKYNDPLRYKSFVAYPEIGVGSTAESAEYSISSVGNGLSFNITSYLDSGKYIENNLIDFCDLLRSQFEYEVFRLFLTNANAISDRKEQNITNNENSIRILSTETLDIAGYTIAAKYKEKITEAKEAINNTLDRFLKTPTKFKVKRRALG